MREHVQHQQVGERFLAETRAECVALGKPIPRTLGDLLRWGHEQSSVATVLLMSRSWWLSRRTVWRRVDGVATQTVVKQFISKVSRQMRRMMALRNRRWRVPKGLLVLSWSWPGGDCAVGALSRWSLSLPQLRIEAGGGKG